MTIQTTAGSAPHGPRYLTAEEVRAALPMSEAIAALDRGFRARDQLALEGTPRSVLPITADAAGRGGDADSDADGELLLMPAQGPEGAGVKLVTIVRANVDRGLPLIQGLYVLLAAGSLAPELLIDGAALTGLRTAAVSGLATRYLARADSRRLVVFGAGTQGRAHVEAMRTVLGIEQVTIVGSSPASPRARSLADALAADGLTASVGEPSAIREADVICACTTSAEPVFADEDLRPGTHVNAVGAYRTDMAEVPPASLGRAQLTVESIEAALEGAGDVVAAIAAGCLPAHGFAQELAAVLGGSGRRRDDAQVTIFKSVGLSTEDLILARAIAAAV